MSTTINSYFKTDKKRAILAQQGKLIELKKTYETDRENNNKNPNTQIFWDKKMLEKDSVNEVDHIKLDRIKTAVDLIGKNKKQLLDVGLGYGDFELLVSRKRKKIKLSGLDISKKSIIKIKKIIEGNFIVGSIKKIPFKENSFDVVVALEILEHLSAYEVNDAYSEIKRVLKSSGQFIVSVPVFEKYTHNNNPNRHLRSYMPILIEKELEMAGFKINKIKTLCAFSKIYVIKKIIRKLLPNRWNPNVVILSCSIK